MEEPQSTYVVTREDRAQDPVTFTTDGLAIGRLTDCEVCLNHPTVSRLHAGVRKIDGSFYIFHLSPSNSTTLNGTLVEEKAALADGDLLQVGPFFLRVSLAGDSLALRVAFQPGVRIGDVELKARARREGVSRDERTAALDLFWEKRKREAGKIARPSQLRPRGATRLGKTRHNWTPTRDLARSYPVSLFAWALVFVGLLTAAAAFGYTSAFAPAPVSSAHARVSLAQSPAIAAQPNANSCTTCHTVARTMNEACASCHQTQAFDPKETAAHAAAGVGCVACHAEHRGRDFRAGVAPLSASFQPDVAREETCAGCHSDSNRQTYNGRAVHTPHGGMLGYPVADGHWIWKGLDDASWNAKPEDVKRLLLGWKATSEDERRSVEFHALHLQRVRAPAGMKSNEAGELTCSSCHRSLGASLDRATPRTTCVACHAGLIDQTTGRAIIAPDAPNCVSCHVQHTGDRARRGASLLANK